MTCFEVLGISDMATPDEVRAAWRRLNSKLHPDRGGNAEAHRRARAAYDDAIVKAAVCPTCAGKGKIDKPHGWTQMTVCCSYCKGSGVRS